MGGGEAEDIAGCVCIGLFLFLRATEIANALGRNFGETFFVGIARSGEEQDGIRAFAHDEGPCIEQSRVAFGGCALTDKEDGGTHADAELGAEAAAVAMGVTHGREAAADEFAGIDTARDEMPALVVGLAEDGGCLGVETEVGVHVGYAFGMNGGPDGEVDAVCNGFAPKLGAEDFTGGADEVQDIDIAEKGFGWLLKIGDAAECLGEAEQRTTGAGGAGLHGLRLVNDVHVLHADGVAVEAAEALQA